MNEQLLSELKAKSSTTRTEYFDGRGNVTSTSFDYRKFAELIVKECAKIAEQHIDERWDLDFGAGVMLKQHFGIE